MWIIQRCRDRWLKDGKKDISWDDIMFAAEKTPSLDSYINVDAQAFIMEKADMPGAVIAFCKENSQKIPSNMGEVARVIYESFALKVKQNVGQMEKLTGQKMKSIHMVGGGTKDTLLCQWVADATGIPVATGPTETTSVGNLLMQLKAAGEIKTLEEGRQICLDSSVIKHYRPVNTGLWDDKYSKFMELF